MSSSIEIETQDLSMRASGILELLAHGTATNQAQHQQILDEASVLACMWHSHLESLSVASEFIVSRDSHFASFLAQMEKDAATVMRSLDCLGALQGSQRLDVWEESLGPRVREAVVQALHLVSREQTTVIPLVRRWRSTRAETLPLSISRPELLKTEFNVP